MALPSCQAMMPQPVLVYTVTVTAPPVVAVGVPPLLHHAYTMYAACSSTASCSHPAA